MSKNPANMICRASLCKLVFPFHNPNTQYDEASDRFFLQPGTLPVPRFPIEGIYTRNAMVAKSSNGDFDIIFLETSSPGLRGQSGGPIFDTDGNIWAIQSHTSHLPLGFSPKVISNNKEVEENQFINVGMGIHASTIIGFLRRENVKFDICD